MELSELHQFITVQLIAAEPKIHASSQINTIRLYKVTDNDTTFITWETDFSNDADAEVIEDNKFKKKEFFGDLKKSFTK